MEIKYGFKNIDVDEKRNINIYTLVHGCHHSPIYCYKRRGIFISIVFGWIPNVKIINSFKSRKSKAVCGQYKLIP